MAQMPAYRSRYGDTITDLLARRGDIAAAGALRSGDIWGSTVGNLGAIAGQAVQGYAQVQQEKKQAEAMKARDAAIADIFSSEAANDPQQLFKALIHVTDPKSAMAMAEGAAELKKMSTAGDPKMAMSALPGIARAFMAAPDSLKPGLWGVVRQSVISSGIAKPEELPEQYDPETVKGYVDFALGLEKPEKPQGLMPVAPGTRVFDPNTRQEVFAAPERPEKPKPSLAEIEAEAAARARGTASVRPPETPAELVLNPEGVVLSSYGPKHKNEVRRQAMERGLPVFENQAAQSKGVVLAGIVDDAKELAGLLEQDEVRAAIGPLAGRWAQLKAKAFDLPPKVQRAIQLMTSLSDTELRKRSGAQINEKEMERLLRFTTDPNKPLGHNITAVEGLWSSGARDYKALSGMDLGQPPVVPQIKDEAEYNALPAGAVYIDPNGKRRRKGVQ